MAIDAIIEKASIESDGTIRLDLVPRSDSSAGQPFLYVINPPENAEAFMKAIEGTQIWGGSSEVLIGQKKWADRIGYTSIRLLDQKKPHIDWQAAIIHAESQIFG